jgi:hypothetical protein
VDEKRVRLFHSLHRRRDGPLATAEQLYLHVSAGKVTPMARVRERLTRVQARRSCPCRPSPAASARRWLTRRGSQGAPMPKIVDHEERRNEIALVAAVWSRSKF